MSLKSKIVILLAGTIELLINIYFDGLSVLDTIEILMYNALGTAMLDLFVKFTDKQIILIR